MCHQALLAGDGVEEGTGDLPAPATARPKRYAFGVEQFGQGLVSARIDERGLVELVPAQPRARGSERAVLKERRRAVA